MESLSSDDAFPRIAFVANELASHVRNSFGPVGKRAIIVDDVGKVSVTKNGLRILRALRCSDPFATMIIRALESHVNAVSWSLVSPAKCEVRGMRVSIDTLYF